MHLHKTGGTSMKNAFHKAYSSCTKHHYSKNLNDASGNTSAATIPTASMLVKEGSCRKRAKLLCEHCSLYSCSWNHLLDLSESQRNLIDVAFGHQFLHGEESLSELLFHRSVRSFTVLRHPFARKFSMFFHFHVRQSGLKAEDILVSDIVSFLLREEGQVADTAMKIDIGPNYYTGRLLSEGYHTYSQNITKDAQHKYFKVEPNKETVIIKNAKAMLETFEMTGIYEWPRATHCMTIKMLHAFNDALGIERMEEEDSQRIVEERFSELMIGKKLNMGEYHKSKSASSVWTGLSEDERREFEEHEGIDMEIYGHGVKLFIKQVHNVGCERELKMDVDEMRRGDGQGDGDFDGLLDTVVKLFSESSATEMKPSAHIDGESWVAFQKRVYV